jgi:four helix bundle protein
VNFYIFSSDFLLSYLFCGKYLAFVENNIILQKTLHFASSIVDSTGLLHPSNRIIGNQLVRSGTAIGALVSEAQSAESIIDFVHKLKIADKEANETLYWLCILEKQMPGFSDRLKEDLIEIKKLLTSIIITCRKKQKR